jgi:hypothetical protein
MGADEYIGIDVTQFLLQLSTDMRDKEWVETDLLWIVNDRWVATVY